MIVDVIILTQQIIILGKCFKIVIIYNLSYKYIISSSVTLLFNKVDFITINDIYVCEYDGIGTNEGQGKYVEWKGYIKSSNQENLVLFESDNKQIICDIGAPEYYMGDPYYYETYATDNIVPQLNLIEDYGNITSHRIVSQEEMENSHLGIYWRIYKRCMLLCMAIFHPYYESVFT